MAKWFITALVLLLIISNAFWLLLIIDTSVTQSYQQQTTHELNQTVKSYRQLCHQLIVGKQASEVKKLLTNIDTETTTTVPFEKEGYIHSNWLSIKMTSNKAIDCSDSTEQQQ